MSSYRLRITTRRGGISKTVTPPASPKNASSEKFGSKPRTMGMVDWTRIVEIKAVDNDDNEQHFTVHKSYICHYSPFYRQAFNSRFLEGITQSISEFPVTVESFGIFVNWLYSQNLIGSDGNPPSIQELINVWVLADAKLIPSLQNTAMIALNNELAKAEDLPLELFTHLYEHTGDGSLLRKLFIDVCAGRLSQLEKVELSSRFPVEMLVDLVKAGGEQKPPRSPKSSKVSKDKIAKYLFSEDIRLRRGAGVFGGNLDRGSSDEADESIIVDMKTTTPKTGSSIISLSD